MPIKLCDLRAMVRETTLDVYGEKLKVRYRLGELTPARTEEVNARLKDDSSMAEFWARTLEVIEIWDLVDDAGQIIPLTPAGLAQVPTPVLSTIYQKVLEDASPNSKKVAS